MLNKSAMHLCGNFIVVIQSRKFWLYLLLSSSMLLHDAIMTSYWHVYLFTVPVNLVYVKLYGLATKIRLWSKNKQKLAWFKRVPGVRRQRKTNEWKSFLKKVGAKVDCLAASCLPETNL